MSGGIPSREKGIETDTLRNGSEHHFLMEQDLNAANARLRRMERQMAVLAGRPTKTPKNVTQFSLSIDLWPIVVILGLVMALIYILKS